MNVIVIHGHRCTSAAPEALAFAVHFGISNIVTDPELDIVPFPTSDVLLFTDRRPIDIYYWRAQHRPAGTGEVLRFLTWKSAQNELAQALTAPMRRALRTHIQTERKAA
ncbi:MAG TPA: hypothetical protein VF503_20190 [Sphingobium sp.]|uniref:hypothetical protein n=1 Tax=Sphingobium sp. TaxID=1912891 RepID=UPI002ED0AEB1